MPSLELDHEIGSEMVSTDNLTIVLDTDMKTKSKQRESKMKEILSTFCAVLNSHGGRVRLVHESNAPLDELKRVIKQRLSDVLGFSRMVNVINPVPSSPGETIISVDNVSGLVTLSYNIYVPTDTQVLVVPPKTPVTEIREMMTEKRIVDADDFVKLGTHHKEFVLEQKFIHESKTLQLKCLKAEKSQCVSLGDRMLSKANKLTSYVSAFANYHGGHIYYGINDDGVVRGEVVENKEEIIKKVSRAINKMVWPMEQGSERGQQYDIFFEPVNDVTGNAVPSTFVIVVWVGYCTGGVFTEEPESYHIVNGKVVRMSFGEWKQKIFEDHIPQNVPQVQWSSKKKKNTVYNMLAQLSSIQNHGNKQDFYHFVCKSKQCYSSSPEVLLAIVSQQAIFACRSSKPSKAESFIKDYHKLCKENSEQVMFFDCFGLRMKSTKECLHGNYEKCLEITAPGLQMLDLMAPELGSVWFYIHVAWLLTTCACSKISVAEREEMFARAKMLYKKALEQSERASSFSKCVADTQQNIYIHLASLYLGCAMDGTIDSRVTVSSEDIHLANNCLMMVNKLVLEGHPLNFLRHTQYHMAMSFHSLRRSMVPGLDQQQRKDLLKSSVKYSDEALKLATDHNFKELACYSRQQRACVTEEVVRCWVQNV